MNADIVDNVDINSQASYIHLVFWLAHCATIDREDEGMGNRILHPLLSLLGNPALGAWCFMSHTSAGAFTFRH